MLEAYLEILEEAYYEVKFAFEGLADENVWKRPAEGLLSVGEHAGHIAYWEAMRFAGDGGNGDVALVKFDIDSVLLDHHFRYYPSTLATSPSAKLTTLTAEQVCNELLRVHAEAMERFKALNPDLDGVPPGQPEYFTYRASLKYGSFHVAYHTGQMFAARHLLGEETPDN